MPFAVYEKDPDARIDYTIAWSDWLEPLGDVITASTLAVDAGLTAETQTFTAYDATVWLSGGTTGSSYAATNRITTRDGRTNERTIVLRVLQSTGTPSAVTVADVREVLGDTRGVSDALINEFIGAWRSRFELAAGDLSGNPRAVSVMDAGIRLGAASNVLSALWSAQSNEEPSNARAMREQAEALIKTVDAMTSGTGKRVVESVAVVEKVPWS